MNRRLPDARSEPWRPEHLEQPCLAISSTGTFDGDVEFLLRTDVDDRDGPRDGRNPASLGRSHVRSRSSRLRPRLADDFAASDSSRAIAIDCDL